MIDFVMMVGTASISRRNHDLSRFCAYRPERVIEYRTSHHRNIAVTAFWRGSHPFHRLSERVRVDDSGFALLAGYPLDENLRPIITVDKFDPVKSVNYKGDYFYLSIDENSQICIKKSEICSYQIYYTQGEEFDVLGSRATLVAVTANDTNKPEPNLEFARWMCTYGGGGNTCAIFENTQIVLSNQTVSFENNRLVIGKQDYRFLYDQEMRDRYKRSPKKYWDEVYDYLIASTAVLDFSDQEIDFPLTGGKDSRLLLGLILAGGRGDRLRRVFTNGPAISPEVRSSRLVCAALGLKHEFVDHTKVDQPRQFSVDDKILRHVHMTEGEMSPDDLTWGGRRQRIIQLHGQESGLRNIAGNRDVGTREKLIKWFDIHLVGGDKCNLYASGIGERNMDETRQYVDAAIAASVHPSDIPTLHRAVLRSGRWVSRTWRSYNDRYFAPYIFTDSELLKASFNSGSKARARAEFHFEMMRRVKPELIEIPFSGQSWDPSLVEESGFNMSAPLHWPERTRPHTTKKTHFALHRSFEDFRSFFAKHQGHVTNRLLDRDKLMSFDIEDIHPSIFLALWNFVQISVLELAPELETLTGGASGPDIGLPSFDF